jgi:hypothetical protein
MQTQTLKEAKYDNFVLINLAFSAYSGLVALDKSELGVNVDKELITSGELKTVSRDKLKVFGALKAKARTACLRYGTSFMGGYAIPIAKWKEVQQQLADIRAEYEQEAALFIANYDIYLREWADKYSADRETLLKKAHPQDWVKNRFPASYSGCHLTPAEGMEDEIASQVDGMYEQICKEIATDAKQAIRAYEKGSNITTKMVGTFKGMVDKINALSFVNSSLEPLGKTINDYVRDLFPASGGKIDGDVQSKIAILLTAMTNPENLADLSSVLQVKLGKVAKAHSATPDAQQSNDEEELLLLDDSDDGFAEEENCATEAEQTTEDTEVFEVATEATEQVTEPDATSEEDSQESDELLLLDDCETESEPESESQPDVVDEDDEDFVLL